MFYVIRPKTTEKDVYFYPNMNKRKTWRVGPINEFVWIVKGERIFTGPYSSRIRVVECFVISSEYSFYVNIPNETFDDYNYIIQEISRKTYNTLRKKVS